MKLKRYSILFCCFFKFTFQILFKLELKSITKNEMFNFGYLIRNQNNSNIFEYLKYDYNIFSFKEKLCENMNYDNLHAVFIPCKIKNETSLAIIHLNNTFQL